MATVKISKQFQVIIPAEIREQLSLVPGQTLVRDVFEGVIRIRVRCSLRSLRGQAKGMFWKDIYRDRIDRF
jgi:AbrB family looped-hinge helix DNA binding protein